VAVAALDDDRVRRTTIAPYWLITAPTATMTMTPIHAPPFSASGLQSCCRRRSSVVLHFLRLIEGGAVAQRVERWTYDQQVVGSNEILLGAKLRNQSISQSYLISKQIHGKI